MLIFLLFLSFSVDSDGQPTTPHIEENILQRPKKNGLLPVKKMPNFFFHFAWEKKIRQILMNIMLTILTIITWNYRDFQWKSNTFTQIEDIEILNHGEVKFISSPKLYLNHKNTKINFIWKSEPKLYQY